MVIVPVCIFLNMAHFVLSKIVYVLASMTLSVDHLQLPTAMLDNGAPDGHQQQQILQVLLHLFLGTLIPTDIMDITIFFISTECWFTLCIIFQWCISAVKPFSNKSINRLFQNYMNTKKSPPMMTVLHYSQYKTTGHLSSLASISTNITEYLTLCRVHYIQNWPL